VNVEGSYDALNIHAWRTAIGHPWQPHLKRSAWRERRKADAGWNDTHLQRAASAFDDIVMS
jgi:hypothetical protein